MKKFAKNMIAFALVMALLLSLFPATANAAHSGQWTYLPSSYSWITGSFQSSDDDLVYENDQPYDWQVIITPSRRPPETAQIEASIKDAGGNLISSCNTTVSGLTQHEDNVLCSAADFPFVFLWNTHHLQKVNDAFGVASFCFSAKRRKRRQGNPAVLPVILSLFDF